MKGRPRKVEREIAKIMTKQLSDIGIDFEFKRVPIIGRTGPDLTYPNPFHLAIDIKSRLRCPKAIFEIVDRNPDRRTWVRYTEELGDNSWFVCRVGNLADVIRGWHYAFDHYMTSTTINRWLNHMNSWDGLRGYDAGALVLHRPRMPYGKSVLIFHELDWINLLRKWQEEGVLA